MSMKVLELWNYPVIVTIGIHTYIHAYSLGVEVAYYQELTQ